jgi:hypothetical protein
MIVVINTCRSCNIEGFAGNFDTTVIPLPFSEQPPAYFHGKVVDISFIPFSKEPPNCCLFGAATILIFLPSILTHYFDKVNIDIAKAFPRVRIEEDKKGLIHLNWSFIFLFKGGK